MTDNGLSTSRRDVDLPAFMPTVVGRDRQLFTPTRLTELTRLEVKDGVVVSDYYQVRLYGTPDSGDWGEVAYGAGCDHPLDALPLEFREHLTGVVTDHSLKGCWLAQVRGRIAPRELDGVAAHCTGWDQGDCRLVHVGTRGAIPLVPA